MSTLERAGAWRAARWTTVGLACLLQAAWARNEPQAVNPLGGGQAVTLEPAPPPAEPRRHRAVFVCQENGVPVYTDRPCGVHAVTRSLVVDAPGPGAAATTSPPALRASTRPRPVTSRPPVPVAPAADDRCTRLRQRLDELDDRMRAGYSAREAARLWQRWRDAKERLRASRC